MNALERLKSDYPWIQTPLVVGAPMRLIALADMAVEISKAGGIGFIGAGTDVSDLHTHLDNARKLLHSTTLSTNNDTLPIGIGFINWGANLSLTMPLIQQYKPAAVWFFAPSSLDSLADWTNILRHIRPEMKVWVQVGSVKEARDVVQRVRPDVLVVQGTDAGGHGLAQGAGLISLLPEVCDVLAGLTHPEWYAGPVVVAAGGIAEARGASAAMVLGASGVVLGTRFLACPEAKIARGYQKEVLRASDGGQSTARTKVYDTLRGTTGWAESHNARGILNQSYWDAVKGMSNEENMKLYDEEMGKGDAGWGEGARMTTYAGSAVGLVREVKGAGEIVREVRDGTKKLLEGAKAFL
ncbi:inosine monophosphate dehydrogenase [Ophiobolus disseminans]|uniref:Inosine monophosphate dehydrogenase n=1 Tax=Ophiobolus disseminans TaxID=1469910 RepID=A0A6A7AFI9_9PLEO|nr:inosine monophosphate dehydrogenase [Ophiobolus disseminans]